MADLSRQVIANFNTFMGVIDPRVANAALDAVDEEENFAPIDHVEQVVQIIIARYSDYLSDEQFAAAKHLIQCCESIGYIALLELEQELGR